MPIYELACEHCKISTSKLMSYEEYKKGKFKCDECKHYMHKPISTSNFNLKGEGFYNKSKNRWD